MPHVEPDQPRYMSERVIAPTMGLQRLELRQLWESRELLGFLVWRDVLVRYKQTYLGVAWAVVQPLITVVVFTVIFGHFAQLPSEGAPYAVMTLAALLPWQFFSNALTESSGSVVSSASMITKVYFPRLVLPAGAVLSGLPDMGIGMLMLLGLMRWYGVPLHPAFLLLPLFAGLACLAALAAGLWLSALGVRYRDVRYLVPFVTRVGLYVTPVAFSTSWVTGRLPWAASTVYGLNPLVGIVDGFRWCVLGPAFAPEWRFLLGGTVVTLLLLVSGAYFFRAVERRFADVI